MAFSFVIEQERSIGIKPELWSCANPKAGKVRGKWQIPHWFKNCYTILSGSMWSC